MSARFADYTSHSYSSAFVLRCSPLGCVGCFGPHCWSWVSDREEFLTGGSWVLGNFPEYRLGDERCPIIIIFAVDNFGGFQATSRDFRPKSLKDGRDWTRQTEHLQHASREQPPASPHLRDARRLSSVVVQHGKVAIWGKCMQLPSMVRCRFSYLLVPKTSGLTTQCNTLKPTGCRQSLVFRETIKGIVVAN